MQKIAGAFFEKQYKTVHAEFEDGTICTGHFAPYMVNLGGLSPFIQKIVIKSDEEEELFYFNTKCKESIIEIKFKNVILYESKIEMIKDIVGKAEVIKLYMRQFDGDFFERFLKLVTNLKHLSIENKYFSKTFMMGDNNRWLLLKYPKLEKFEWICEKIRTGELKTLFLQNPTIQHCSTDANTFFRHRKWIMKSQIRLNNLTIVDRDSDLPPTFLLVVKKSHSRGFYEHLHLFSPMYHTMDYRQMIHFPAIDTLYFNGMIIGAGIFSGPRLRTLDLSPFVNITELGIAVGVAPLNIDTVTALVNLERVYIQNATKCKMMPFIRYAPSLQKIIADRYEYDFMDYLSDGGSEYILSEYNIERSKLTGAQKLTIYISNVFYVLVNMCPLSLDFTEFKRLESFQLSSNLHNRLSS